MPTRYIKESARTSKNLSVVSDFAERLFWRLITTADDFGRFLACPQIVKSTCFPLIDSLKVSKVEHALSELHTNNLIGLYAVGDRNFGWFVNWQKHQGKPRATSSKYPDPPLEDPSSCGQLPASAHTCPQPPANAHGAPDTDTITNTDLNSSPNLNPKRADEDFESWWAAMPSRGGKKLYRQKAHEFYLKYVKPDEREQALAAAKAYARHCQQEERLPVDPHRFLNGQRGEVWREFIPTKPVTVKKPSEPIQPPGPFVPPPPELMDRLKKLGVTIPSGAKTSP